MCTLTSACVIAKYLLGLMFWIFKKWLSFGSAWYAWAPVLVSLCGHNEVPYTARQKNRKSKIKVSTRLVFPGLADCHLLAVPQRVFPLGMRMSCVSLILSYWKNSSHTVLGLHSSDSCNPNYLLKGSLSIYSHIGNSSSNIWICEGHSLVHHSDLGHVSLTSLSHRYFMLIRYIVTVGAKWSNRLLPGGMGQRGRQMALSTGGTSVQLEYWFRCHC